MSPELFVLVSIYEYIECCQKDYIVDTMEIFGLLESNKLEL
jgi:hypothetical protein